MRLPRIAVALASVGAFAMSSCRDASSPVEGAAPPAAPIPAPALPPDAPRVVGAATAAVIVTSEARAEADQIFGARCAACHGATGAGDGPTAKQLTPKPRNYHDQKWQQTVTDQEIEKAIVQGGQAVGKSPMMVPNPDLGEKPAVLAALREKIRGFGKQ